MHSMGFYLIRVRMMIITISCPKPCFFQSHRKVKQIVFWHFVQGFWYRFSKLVMLIIQLLGLNLNPIQIIFLKEKIAFLCLVGKKGDLVDMKEQGNHGPAKISICQLLLQCFHSYLKISPQLGKPLWVIECTFTILKTKSYKLWYNSFPFWLFPCEFTALILWKEKEICILESLFWLLCLDLLALLISSCFYVIGNRNFADSYIFFS